LKFYTTFHCFHNIKSSRANSYIFKGEIRNLLKLFTICMRKLTTSLGSYIINRTIIIYSQKGTRYRLQYIIVILVYSQISVYKLLLFHFKMFRYAYNIFICKQRTCSFTAIGTFQAIGLFKLLVM